MEDIKNLIEAGAVNITLSAAQLSEVITSTIEKYEARKRSEKASQDLLTADEVREILHISTTTLWEWDKKGLLPKTKIGGRVLYKRGAVDDLVNKKDKRTNNNYLMEG